MANTPRNDRIAGRDMTVPMPSSPSGSKVPPEFQAFVDARGHPAIFFFVMDMSIGLRHVLELRKALKGCMFDEVDLVINSGGGNIDSAYQIVELVRLHATKVNACIPFYAKSAATLICIGADSIILDELAQLGPLDAQIAEAEQGSTQDYTYVSALNPFKSLEELQSNATEALDLAVMMIAVRSGMNLDICIKHAIQFVHATSGPLFTQLRAEKLGEYSRALSVGQEYAKRLLQRYNGWDLTKSSEIAQKLVFGYPSHEYIIDHYELMEMGLPVELFSLNERDAVEDLIYKQCAKQQTVIHLVTPSSMPHDNP